MPHWNEELQQWGFFYYEEVSEYQWLGISREERVPIDKPYAYHKPSPDGLAKINRLREAFSFVEREIKECCHESRQRSIALTNNEQTAMWAIKAVVFNDPFSEVDIGEKE
jgi:hypothetical protein